MSLEISQSQVDSPHDSPPGLNGERFEEYVTVKHPKSDNEPDFAHMVKTLTNSQENSCIRFQAQGGGHFIRFGGEEFNAIFSGPHGPENRPAKIDKQNLERLYESSNRIDFVSLDESPFQNIALR